MPVQAIATAAQIAARKPHSPTPPLVTPKKIQPIPKTAAGTKVAIDMTPSRESHDERHCEKARHARSGRPRCNADDARPATASATAMANAVKPKPASCGNRPNGTAMPISANSAKPAPEAVVKKTIDSAGCTLEAP